MTAILKDMTYIEDAIGGMSGKTVVFWGAGRRMRGFLRTCCMERKLLPMPDFICDSTRDIPETHIEGVPVMKFEHLKKRNSGDTVIVITAGLLDLQAQVVPSEFYYFPLYHCRSFEAYLFLKDNLQDYSQVMGLLQDDRSRQVYESIFRNLLNGSLWCQSLFEPNAYFGNDLVKNLSDDERVVLAGAFNGKHIDRALADNDRIHVCAFEPNSMWNKYLVDKYQEMPNIEINNKVLWYNHERLEFDGDMLHGGLDARVSKTTEDNPDLVVEGVDMDSFLTFKPTLIALDVEGSEENAIKGASDIIARDRPKLAICLYHKLDDYVRLPLMINEMTSEHPYKLYIRHHSCITAIETVLYAL